MWKKRILQQSTVIQLINVCTIVHTKIYVEHVRLHKVLYQPQQGQLKQLPVFFLNSKVKWEVAECVYLFQMAL